MVDRILDARPSFESFPAVSRLLQPRWIVLKYDGTIFSRNRFSSIMDNSTRAGVDFPDERINKFSLDLPFSPFPSVVDSIRNFITKKKKRTRITRLLHTTYYHYSLIERYYSIIRNWTAFLRRSLTIERNQRPKIIKNFLTRSSLSVDT